MMCIKKQILPMLKMYIKKMCKYMYAYRKTYIQI